MSRFEKVWLPSGASDPSRRFSVTFGRHHNVCPRAGFLYEKHRGVDRSHPMARGSAMHRILELATKAAVQADEVTIPPEIVKSIANDVLAEPGYWCPVEEHDYTREMAYRWAEQETIDPAGVVACETLFVLDVDGVEVRGKIDRADLLEGGAAVRVRDYKSARSMVSFEDIGRRLRDGRIAAKDYQLVLYALLVAFGVPVRIEPCETCKGTGVTPLAPGLPECEPCRGYGYVEVREPFPVADRAQRFDLAYVYPGIPDKEGRINERGVSLTRVELHEYMASLVAQVRQIRHSVETGDWPAMRGDHCSECPCVAECPIPAALRPFTGRINTVGEAQEAAEQLDAEKHVHRARWDELKLFVKSLPGQRLRFGRDQVIEPGYTESEEIPRKDAMFDAIDRAVKYGEPFERSRFVRQKRSTPLRQRRLSEMELAEEAGEVEGSNEKEAV